MKRMLLAILAIIGMYSTTAAQDKYAEPEFTLEGYAIGEDGSELPLFLHPANLKIFKLDFKRLRDYGMNIEEDGGASRLRFKEGARLTFVINTGDNSTSPAMTFRIVEFKTTKKKRKVYIGYPVPAGVTEETDAHADSYHSAFGSSASGHSRSTFTITEGGNVYELPNSVVGIGGGKLGVSSYVVKTAGLRAGEYAIVFNSNNTFIIGDFGVDVK